jgi:hypothetical protein
MVREGGRSSIPETPMIEPKRSGVLDHPLSRMMTVLYAATLSPSLRGAKRRSNPCHRKKKEWIASLRSQ